MRMRISVARPESLSFCDIPAEYCEDAIEDLAKLPFRPFAVAPGIRPPPVPPPAAVSTLKRTDVTSTLLDREAPATLLLSLGWCDDRVCSFVVCPTPPTAAALMSSADIRLDFLPFDAFFESLKIPKRF